MTPSSALPLKVTPASTPMKPQAAPSRDITPTPIAPLKPGEISSPHELTAFVETLLEQLDTKFDEMSSQILDRMGQMSTRVDSLEASIQDIINGDTSIPTSPMPGSSSGGTPHTKRTGSALPTQ
ncbi:hypothetical protein FIBSPDRAFT_874009 [Athelia psychrophila]|uniref:Heat shock factor binding protein 1-domain-containing protein n=1 Tax=Athelia psychrophila TaxID=1759441 RepID=A0A165XZB0_9AGAM|nr:hypothetical protein FIBSPDRAFT_874009 [Fibularhizoctonia sp. CBS 109695]